MGRKLAFSTPRVRAGDRDEFEPGIFLYDRDAEQLTRLTDSEGASQLAFPDFVRGEAIVFMIPARDRGQPSRFPHHRADSVTRIPLEVDTLSLESRSVVAVPESVSEPTVRP